MTEEEKVAAAAYIKLQDDVKKLIVDAVRDAISGELRGTLMTAVVYDGMFETRVKEVVKKQMEKY